MTTTTEPTGAEERTLVLNYLRRQLTGPWNGEDEILTERPDRRYLAGILFPREASVDAGDSDDIADDAPVPGTADATDTDEDPVALAGQMLPSSVGLSFVTSTRCTLRIEVTAARYLKEDRQKWRRQPLAATGSNAVYVEPPPTGRQSSKLLFDSDARVTVVWRDFGEGALVTVSLVNRRTLSEHGRLDPADCLLQVSLRCSPVDAAIVPYPSTLRLHVDPEEEELALLYRKIPVFALGHGAAATWEAQGHHATSVQTTFVPSHVVPDVTFDLTGDQQALSLHYLTGLEQHPAEVTARLLSFVDNYDDWARRIHTRRDDVAPPLAAAADRLLQRVDRARARMREGVLLLERDPTARRAFVLANRAMLMQMVRSGPPFAAITRDWNEPVPAAPGYDDPGRRWRPFQLAFLLLSLPSVVDPAHEDRDLVDLIWFPTGGGKTEAYLGLVAFTVFHRRLTLGDAGAGTTVITRYTLRLLTAQQFQRAATLICASELIRRERPDELGTRPVSIGIWVGGNNSPNRFADAVELLETIRNREPTTKSFQVERCPWCGTRILPSDDAPEQGWGVQADNNSFRMNCPNASCDFHTTLPVSSVDDALYADPPTLLVATVDKFARFTREPRAGVFIGAGPDPGPALIIQDEFHLISGPLGTVVGLYEAAFDVAMNRHGTRPKIVASTATIRRADAQSRGVFGRPIALFPPSGLDADDSYFVRSDHSRPGRLYAGVMPQGHTPLTAMVHLSAAMLNAPVELPLGPQAADAYWTLVAYHNSLRELGKTVTLAHDDIPARLGVIAPAEDDRRHLDDGEIMELTSNIPPADIPRHLQRLFLQRGQTGAVSFVPSTNMISVGVDVPRLGLMLVVGQPKTTAEYIQASSRVGRRQPGLVVTLYSPSKPRDRSHYESFIPYHTSLYRAVEPTSVTPFSVPARTRALHAGMVILARHAHSWRDDRDAAAFDPDDPAWRTLVQEFIARARAADPREAEDVARHVERLEEHWAGLVDRAHPLGGLTYTGGGRERIQLLRKFDVPGRGWPTLDSMRNVDTEARVSVRGEDK
ncbi:Helicase conserved C-terminal domain-containing protein [Micromonospora nigra]|uniref:Helicase conserved C-terminal domain-containing protein n=1 Tax=Micromonospora nigra TaxID=145857 RepID=A0A1C6S980_9ACTN|nr:helicase-related protein [Micromonospora nigra]SCL25966.1 Helicase conserved C-terminal domain-containing protein [Micromonospora nigra]